MTGIALSQVDGFPRVSGDEPSTARAFVTVVTFSPRERG